MTRHDDIAIQLVYLVAGIETKLKTHRVTQRLTNGDDHALTAGGGHIGMVWDLLLYANSVSAWLRRQEGRDFPGVFEYEVTEVLGCWIADAAEAENLSIETFNAKLIELGNKFFAQFETFNQEKSCASI